MFAPSLTFWQLHLNYRRIITHTACDLKLNWCSVANTSPNWFLFGRRKTIIDDIWETTAFLFWRHFWKHSKFVAKRGKLLHFSIAFLKHLPFAIIIIIIIFVRIKFVARGILFVMFHNKTDFFDDSLALVVTASNLIFLIQFCTGSLWTFLYIKITTVLTTTDQPLGILKQEGSIQFFCIQDFTQRGIPIFNFSWQPWPWQWTIRDLIGHWKTMTWIYAVSATDVPPWSR